MINHPLLSDPLSFMLHVQIRMLFTVVMLLLTMILAVRRMIVIEIMIIIGSPENLIELRLDTLKKLILMDF